MADELTTQVLIQIRDGVKDLKAEIRDVRDELGARIGDTNQRLAVLATLTRSIDGRLEKIERLEASAKAGGSP